MAAESAHPGPVSLPEVLLQWHDRNIHSAKQRHKQFKTYAINNKKNLFFSIKNIV